MDAALGWLGDIIRALIRFIPQIILVRSTHAGIKFKYGCNVVPISHENGLLLPTIKWRGTLPYISFIHTGLHIYWPLVTEYEVVPIKRQTTNLQVQYLLTSDLKTIGVSGILVYEIRDVVKLLTECFDYEDTIRDLTLAAVKEVVIQYSLEYIQESGKEMDIELTKTLREQLRAFGVKTIRVTLSDFSQCRMLGLWGVGSFE